MTNSLYLLALDILFGMAEKGAKKTGRSVESCMHQLRAEFESNSKFAAAICKQALEYEAQIKAAVSC